eukprot:jgi/Mesvir1/14406/Mv09793-RA.1
MSPGVRMCACLSSRLCAVLGDPATSRITGAAESQGATSVLGGFMPSKKPQRDGHSYTLGRSSRDCPPLRSRRNDRGGRGRHTVASANGGLSSQVRPASKEWVRETPPSAGLMKEMADFLREDLPHLFDEQGIDSSRYEEKMLFEDPITKYESLSGYLFNIQMLRQLFHPVFELHGVSQTGPLELTTRWSMTMKFWLLPWGPVVTFTGLSIMRVNEASRKFCSHVDVWDSISDNAYFSKEGAIDLIKQLFDLARVPDLSQPPPYEVLLRKPEYEVRKYTSSLRGRASSVATLAPAPGSSDLLARSDVTAGSIMATLQFVGDSSPVESAKQEQQLKAFLVRDGLQVDPSIPSLLAKFQLVRFCLL